MGFRVINGKLYTANDFTDYKSSDTKQTSKTSEKFNEILGKEIKKEQTFTISNHAALRLQNRNISFNEADMNKINDGINMAQQKGAKDCLILYKDVAMVASVRNRTIITAVDKENGKGNVFTNLDSVVLL